MSRKLKISLPVSENIYQLLLLIYTFSALIYARLKAAIEYPRFYAFLRLNSSEDWFEENSEKMHQRFIRKTVVEVFEQWGFVDVEEWLEKNLSTKN